MSAPAPASGEALADALSETRRDLHATPEVGLDLPQTQAYLVNCLQARGIEFRLGDKLSSVTAIVRGTAGSSTTSRRTVMVRSDMDALPITETTGLPFASTNGAAHACGHDLHMAIVLHAATETHKNRDQLQGDAIFVFQPGEEGHGGARLMLEEGVLTEYGDRPEAILGLHVLAHHLPLGTICTRAGAVFAGSTLLDIEIEGRGGHGSAPHLSRSPLLAAADMVNSSLAAVSSRISAFETTVLSYGLLRAGTARNIVPGTAELAGVIRSFDPAVGEAVEDLVRRIGDATALAHEVKVNVHSCKDTLPTVTAENELELLNRMMPGRVAPLSGPLAISEDFSWFLDAVPGVFLLVGAATGDPLTSPSNHSENATFSESVLLPSTQLVVDWVRMRLEVPR